MPIVGKLARIEDALLERLADLTLSPAVPVAWPNIVYSPTVGQPYLEPTFLPNKTDYAGIGQSAPRRHFGLFSISVMGALNLGSAAASEIADSIIEHFAPPLSLDADGLDVRIGSFNGSNHVPWRGSAFPKDGWLMIAVSVPWYCDA